MFKKIKGNLMLMQWAFLIIVVGGSSLIFYLFASDYYIIQKGKMMREAYEELHSVDFQKLDSQDKQLVESYEEENLIFIIADENMEPVYSTKKVSPQNQVYKNISLRMNDFTADPHILRTTSKLMGVIRLPGLIEQNGQKYYVCIKEEIKSVYSSFKYTQSFLFFVIVISLLIGSIVMYMMSNRIAKPIEEIEEVAKRVAKRDFSKKAKTESSFTEISSLGENINTMSEQIQDYILRLEVDKDRLQAKNSQQEKMDDVRKEFMANISHELKTPITVISSQVEMLQCMGNEIDRDYYYNSIVEEVSKMSDMIGNMLNLTVVEHNMETMQKGKVSLTDMLEYLMLKYDALFRQNQIKCSYHIEPDCTIFGNKVFLEQAVGNYLMNAFHHTPQGGCIEVRLQAEGESVYIKVYNEGAQIPKNDIEKIWKSFYMRRTSEQEISEEKTPHAGLGLYIVRSIVGLHHGECGVQNINEGVEFWLKLPLI